MGKELEEGWGTVLPLSFLHQVALNGTCRLTVGRHSEDDMGCLALAI